MSAGGRIAVVGYVAWLVALLAATVGGRRRADPGRRPDGSR